MQKVGEGTLIEVLEAILLVSLFELANASDIILLLLSNTSLVILKRIQSQI